MRQQLISWLIEDIAPEIRHSKDAEGEILKFARGHNLATTQVQALGQLYNTAKTLSFFEKSASRRGEPFPILDVEQMLEKFTSVEKKASMPAPRIEFDDMDNGCGISLPACFSGLTHNVFREEQPAPAQIYDNPVKRASMEKSETGITIELTKQAYFEAQEDMRKFACNIVAQLRREPTYPFSELEADAWAIFGDEVKPIMEKLAKFCQDDGWPIKRASAPSADKLVMDYGKLMPMVESIMDRTYLLKAAIEILQPSSEAAGSGPMHTAAKIVDSEKGKVVLKDASAAGTMEPPTEPPVEKINPPKIQEQNHPKGDRSDIAGGAGRSSQSPSGTGGGGGGRQMPPGKSPSGGRPAGGGGGGAAAAATGHFRDLSQKLDELVGFGKGVGKFTAPYLLPNRNADQEKVDGAMQDAKHLSVLQNLMTTDEMLAEADPDHVVSLYNTIRTMAPQLAGDANVMRVLLRSAVQHEGIAPFDLNSILETELNKQRIDQGIGQVKDKRYNLKPTFGGSQDKEKGK